MLLNEQVCISKVFYSCWVSNQQTVQFICNTLRFDMLRRRQIITSLQKRLSVSSVLYWPMDRLSQLRPIHRHHHCVIWIRRRLEVPVGQFVKHRGYLHCPVLLVRAGFVDLFQHQAGVALWTAELLSLQPAPSEGHRLLLFAVFCGSGEVLWDLSRSIVFNLTGH